MLPGYNHNVRYKDRVFHVQTEDNGLAQPRLVTQVFIDGHVIALEKSEYADVLALDERARMEAVRARMQDQHKRLLKQLVGGVYDDKIDRYLNPATPVDFEIDIDLSSDSGALERDFNAALDEEMRRHAHWANSEDLMAMPPPLEVPVEAPRPPRPRPEVLLPPLEDTGATLPPGVLSAAEKARARTPTAPTAPPKVAAPKVEAPRAAPKVASPKVAPAKVESPIVAPTKIAPPSNIDPRRSRRLPEPKKREAPQPFPGLNSNAVIPAVSAGATMVDMGPPAALEPPNALDTELRRAEQEMRARYPVIPAVSEADDTLLDFDARDFQAQIKAQRQRAAQMASEAGAPRRVQEKSLDEVLLNYLKEED